jgi:GNAT superfamily N-acetyltransferase
VEIRPATADDVDVIAVVLGEIEAYYGGGSSPVDKDGIVTALFSERSPSTCLLAVDGDDVLGLAAYSFLWPAAGSESSLFLKELYVRESARRQGVATELMAAVKLAGAAAGCTRVEWLADRDNPAALDFYAAFGAAPRDDKAFYRVEL